jgi:hypothetical protein
VPAQADPDLALRLAKAVADVYGQAVADLLALVAKRLARGIDRPGWAERRLLDQLALREEALAVVERLAVAGPEAITEAITTAYRRGAGLQPPSTRAVDALVRETVTQVAGTHGQVLRSVLDAYRDVVAETAAQLTAGNMTRRQAAQAALDRWATRGITGFVDRAGRRWDLASYAEMATRTANGRAQVAGTLDRLVEGGHGLVIVSNHPQECALCRPWEGKVLSITGATPAGTQLAGGTTVAGSVAQAQADGLQHANCRHSLTAYVPGLTVAPTHTADPAGDRARQEQRRLERGLRMWRQREAVALDDTARRKARAHAAEWRERLAAHVEQNDLQRRRDRERVGAR